MSIMVWMQCIKAFTQSLHHNKIWHTQKRQSFFFPPHILYRSGSMDVRYKIQMLVCYSSVDLGSLTKTNHWSIISFLILWKAFARQSCLWTHRFLEMVPINSHPLIHSNESSCTHVGDSLDVLHNLKTVLWRNFAGYWIYPNVGTGFMCFSTLYQRNRGIHLGMKRLS